MSRANDGGGETRRLMRALRQIRDRSGMTLAAAEVVWRAMPEGSLAPETVRAILATVVQRQAADPAFLVWQAWGEGVYWDQASGDRESYWAPIVPVAEVVPESYQIVFEVLLDCRGLDRRQTSDLIRGLVEWDACLDPRGLDARQWTWRHELRCDRADCDQDNVVGLFSDGAW